MRNATMVLESLTNALTAEKHPAKVILYGFVYASVGLFLSLWVFKEQASLVMVFLTAMASIPLIYNTIKLEEKKDIAIEKEAALLREHAKALVVFMFLFLGFIIAFTLWYVVLPSDIVQNAFRIQTQTYLTINPGVSGNVANSMGNFTRILFNNLKVLIFCLLFAFLYGVGAIFILTWNASVIGLAMGNFIRTNMSKFAQSFNLLTAAGYLEITTKSVLRYWIHGTPEILAYFVGGLAGGIISIAVIRHDFGTEKFEKIVLDSTELVIIALVLLVIAALLEVNVTPLFFI